MVNKMKDMGKRGWIRIVEAFVVILLITGVLLIVISEKHSTNPDLNSEIYNSQLNALREIQMNDSLRQLILDATTPVESGDAGFPQDVKTRIEYSIPNYLECKAKICEIKLECDLDSLLKKSIDVQSVAITATLQDYNPRQLKLFCWKK